MSVQALNAVRTHRFGSASRKLLMHVLADYAAADWSTWVGQKRLAAESELGLRTVQRILAAFEVEGLIRRETRYRAARYRTTDRLVLVEAAIEALPASMAAIASPRRARRPCPPLTTDLAATDDGPSRQSLASQESTVNLAEPGRASARGGDPQVVGEILPGLRLVAGGKR